MRTNNLLKFLLKSSFLVFNLAWCIAIFLGLRKARRTIADGYAEVSEGEESWNSKIYKITPKSVKIESSNIGSSNIDELYKTNLNSEEISKNSLNTLDPDQVFYFTTLPQIFLIIHLIIFIVHQVMVNLEAVVLFRAIQSSDKTFGANKTKVLNKNLKIASEISFLAFGFQILSTSGLGVAMWMAIHLDCDFGMLNALSCDNEFQWFYSTGFWLILSWPVFVGVGMMVRWYWMIGKSYEKVQDAIRFG